MFSLVMCLELDSLVLERFKKPQTSSKTKATKLSKAHHTSVNKKLESGTPETRVLFSTLLSGSCVNLGNCFFKKKKQLKFLLCFPVFLH